MQSNSTMIRKLQRAINEKFHYGVLINHTQWYSESQDRPITTITIKKNLPREKDQKYSKTIELFKTTSEIQVILFLRDLWYELNGWEVPTNNPVWEEAKKSYIKKSGG